MSTGAIIAIVVVAALIIIALFVFMRSRRDARILNQRRKEAVQASRRESEMRATEAERADQRARVAQAEAERMRAESRVHSERAAAYEQGLADDELIAQDGREDGTERETDTEAQTRPA